MNNVFKHFHFTKCIIMLKFLYIFNLGAFLWCRAQWGLHYMETKKHTARAQFWQQQWSEEKDLSNRREQRTRVGEGSAKRSATGGRPVLWGHIPTEAQYRQRTDLHENESNLPVQTKDDPWSWCSTVLTVFPRFLDTEGVVSPHYVDNVLLVKNIFV